MADKISIESAKEAAAKRAVAEHFDPSYKFVGIGSGTTIIYVVNAIKDLLASSSGAGSGDPPMSPTSAVENIKFVPTGYQSRQVIIHAGLMPVAFDSLPENQMLDVAFDGADEVDEELNCIKGGGACLFQEKLVAERARKWVCVADYRKAQSRLLTQWPSIPIEAAPIAIHTVLKALRNLGSKHPLVRDGLLAKTGPLKTDQDFFIIDAPFPPLLMSSELTDGTAAGGQGNIGAGDEGKWEVTELSKKIKSITGVLEVGIFSGMNGLQASEAGRQGGEKPVAVYFGMEDGSVTVRKEKEK